MGPCGGGSGLADISATGFQLGAWSWTVVGTKLSYLGDCSVTNCGSQNTVLWREAGTLDAAFCSSLAENGWVSPQVFWRGWAFRSIHLLLPGPYLPLSHLPPSSRSPCISSFIGEKTAGWILNSQTIVITGGRVVILGWGSPRIWWGTCTSEQWWKSSPTTGWKLQNHPHPCQVVACTLVETLLYVSRRPYRPRNSQTCRRAQRDMDSTPGLSFTFLHLCFPLLCNGGNYVVFIWLLWGGNDILTHVYVQRSALLCWVLSLSDW